MLRKCVACNKLANVNLTSVSPNPKVICNPATHLSKCQTNKIYPILSQKKQKQKQKRDLSD